MDKIPRTEVKPLIKKIRREAREKYNTYPPNVQEMYRNEQCQMGGEHMTVRQLNRCILMEIPPVCLKHYKQMQGELEKLAPLFNQLSLL